MQVLSNILEQAGGPRLREQLARAVRRLSAAGVDNPRLDAEVLLADCLAMGRAQMVAAGDLLLDQAAARRFDALVARRVDREPVAYITGKQEFWSRAFTVTPAVLIPRPDTERLVEVALLCAERIPASTTPRIADLCTGSGAVAVSLAGELPAAQICAADISPAALAIARSNAARHRVAQRIEFFAGDLFGAFAPPGARSFDLIVGNPPYVRRGEIAALAPEVSRWEPRLALDGGADGLEFYRRIFAEAPDYLAERGALVLEVGADQASAVMALCTATARYREIEIHQDYAGKDRVVLARLGRT